MTPAKTSDDVVADALFALEHFLGGDAAKLVERLLARVQELEPFVKELSSTVNRWQTRALTAESRVQELEREVVRLKEALKNAAQETHLVSVRLANVALSPEDLKALLSGDQHGEG